jgi:hypothetical protein
MLLAPLVLARQEFPLYELADRLAIHPQFVIHPGRFIVGHGEPEFYPTKNDMASALPLESNTHVSFRAGVQQEAVPVQFVVV